MVIRLLVTTEFNYFPFTSEFGRSRENKLKTSVSFAPTNSQR